jgi:hypothetical protein
MTAVRVGIDRLTRMIPSRRRRATIGVWVDFALTAVAVTAAAWAFVRQWSR